MQTSTLPKIEQLIMEVASDGYAIIDNFLPPEQIAALHDEAKAMKETGEMRRAGTGRGNTALLDDNLRGDFIHWLEDPNSGESPGESIASPARQAYLQQMESLRESLNRNFYLGLFDFETHFAIYPPGTFYRKHLDQFHSGQANQTQQNQQHKIGSSREVSCILYLNQDWQHEDGGQLRIYLEGENNQPCLDVEPVGGRLVAFLSSRFWHEVLPAKRGRASLTGWFRTRAW